MATSLKAPTRPDRCSHVGTTAWKEPEDGVTHTLKGRVRGVARGDNALCWGLPTGPGWDQPASGRLQRGEHPASSVVWAARGMEVFPDPPDATIWIHMFALPYPKPSGHPLERGGLGGPRWKPRSPLWPPLHGRGRLKLDLLVKQLEPAPPSCPDHSAASGPIPPPHQAPRQRSALAALANAPLTLWPLFPFAGRGMWSSVPGPLILCTPSKKDHVWIYPVGVLATMCPEVGGVSPFSILNVVLFPAPFTPRSPKHCREGTRKGKKF